MLSSPQILRLFIGAQKIWPFYLTKIIHSIVLHNLILIKINSLELVKEKESSFYKTSINILFILTIKTYQICHRVQIEQYNSAKMVISQLYLLKQKHLPL